MQIGTPLTIEPGMHGAPNGWRWELLTNLAKLESGHTPSRHRPDWWGGDVPWLALPDIRNLDGKVALDTKEHTNEAGLENSSARLLPTYTVCLSRTASVGHVTLLGRPMATSQDFVNWICGPGLDPFFLMHVLIASRGYLRTLSSGAIHKTIYVPTVQAFRVCIPPFVEQRRLAAVLNEQMAAYARTRSLIEARIEAASRLFSSFLRAAFSKIEVTQAKRSPLGSLSRVTAGGTPSRGNKQYFQGTIPWVKTLDLNLGRVVQTEELITEAALGSIRGALLPPETVMVAMYGGAGTIGKTGVLGIEAATNQAVCCILPNPDLFDSRFLHYWLMHVRKEWMELSGGNRRDPNISKGAVEGKLFPCPPAAVQRRIADVLDQQRSTARELMACVESEMKAVERLPGSFLRRTFAGDA